MSDQLALLPEYLTGHLQLTMLALLFAVAASIPLGIIATRVKWLEQPLLGTAGIIQTIPSLALLAVMVPALAFLGLQSIGFLPALIGLTLYGLLPILRNTVTGIQGVDPALTEAARGVGMTESQQLWRVDLPLALPVIVGGVRTATVWTVGIATLSTPVGATSLGNYIFSGLQTRNFTAVVVGSVAAAILALILDGLVHLLEIGVRDRRREYLLASGTVFALLFGYVAITLAAPLLQGGDVPIRIGSKAFTEQYILADIIADQVTATTGLETEKVASLGSTVVFDAVATGNIDLYVDYSGTLWATILKRPEPPLNRQEAIEVVTEYLRAEHGMTVIGSLGFENTYALAMRREEAEARSITTISDLVPFAPRMSIGADFEFFSRAEWKSIHDHYGIRFGKERQMDSALMYQAVAGDAVDVISAYSTDGRIAALDLFVLQDDKGAIPPYDALMVASRRLREEQPEVLEALQELVGTIDAGSMRAMNFDVDENGESAASVARRFLAKLRSGD
ncbi:MAG: ABC transporter permease/substrate-binding protein [Candidatus Binatia bacterium]|nr:ABC transporter permease/substrate-binding protein [Candidatus Binatia bacterium]